MTSPAPFSAHAHVGPHGALIKAAVLGVAHVSYAHSTAFSRKLLHQIKRARGAPLPAVLAAKDRMAGNIRIRGWTVEGGERKEERMSGGERSMRGKMGEGGMQEVG